MTAGGHEESNGEGVQKAELVSSVLYREKRSRPMRLFSSLLQCCDFERKKDSK